MPCMATFLFIPFSSFVFPFLRKGDYLKTKNPAIRMAGFLYLKSLFNLVSFTDDIRKILPLPRLRRKRKNIRMRKIDSYTYILY